MDPQEVSHGAVRVILGRLGVVLGALGVSKVCHRQGWNFVSVLTKFLGCFEAVLSRFWTLRKSVLGQPWGDLRVSLGRLGVVLGALRCPKCVKGKAGIL